MSAADAEQVYNQGSRSSVPVRAASGELMEIDPIAVRRLARWACGKCRVFFGEDEYQEAWCEVIKRASRHQGGMETFRRHLSRVVLQAIISLLRKRLGRTGGKSAFFYTSSLDVRVNHEGSAMAVVDLLPAKDGDPVRPVIVKEELAWVLERARPGERRMIEALLSHGDPVGACEALGLEGRSAVSDMFARLRALAGVPGRHRPWPRSWAGARGSAVTAREIRNGTAEVSKRRGFPIAPSYV